MAKPHLENPHLWKYVDVRNGARHLCLLLRLKRPDISNIGDFRAAVIIKWPFPSQAGTHQPPDGIMGRMEAFENAIEPLSNSEGHSYLMNVATGLGLREWCYYTNDRARFMQSFNQLLAGSEPYPLEVEFYDDDPEWQVWQQFRRAYERGGGKPEGAG